MKRESMEFDVVIVGAGPAGLSTACKLMQLAQQSEQDLMVCVVEKGSEVGAHLLSGAVFETKALDELFPERTPEINMEPKEMYYRIGQRSVVRFLHQKQKEQSENIMEKK